MRLKTCLITILCVLGIAFLMPSNVHADSVTPSIYEATILQGKQSTGKVTFKNEGSTPVVISPKVSAYDPKTLQLITDEKKLFIVMDKETYTVQPQASLILNYELKPPANLAPGTYFNLIILQKISTSDSTVQKNQLGTVDTLSQLVSVNILEDQTTFPLQIKSDFANISFEIIEPGVPFLKPISIKYIYQNNTNYVLQPQGEIQMFDAKSSYSPEYRQLNVTGTKLYPGDQIEETVVITKWHFSDILFGRKVVGRFYNGIDQNTIIKEASQNTYIVYLAVPLAVLILAIAFTRSILADRKKDNA